MTLTAAQLEHRKHGLGGSDIAAVVGLSPWAAPIDVWLAKTGRAPELEATLPMRIGNELEPLVARLYEERTGTQLTVPESTYVDADRPWRLANLDRVLALPGGTHRNVECKTALGAVFHSNEWGADGTDEIPAYYICQTQWQMDIAKMAESDVPAIVGKHFRIFTVLRDRELCAQLDAAAQLFWETYVIPDLQPPIDHTDSSTEFLKRKFSTHADSMIAADVGLDELATRLVAAKSTLELAERDVTLLSNLFRERIGSHAGIQGDAWKATWKRARDSMKTDWEAVARELGATPDVIARHTTIKEGSRRFLFTPPKD